MSLTGPLLQQPEHLRLVAALLGTAVVLCAAGLLLARRRGRRLLGSGAPRGGGARDTVLIVALGCLCVALLGPRLGTRSEHLPARGADLVVLLDVSRSMDAGDTPPSRLQRARRTARDVLRGLGPGDRVALAAFAGHGVLLTPLTHDADALLEMLPFLDAGLVGVGGSQRSDGIRQALGAFSDASARPRVMLVLSDGEDPLGGDPSQGGAEAARAAVRVVGVAFGSQEGARVPDGDTWLRDRHGRDVLSRVDPAPLERLAEMTDGRAFRADRWGEVDTRAVLDAVRRDVSPLPGHAVEREVTAVRVAPFALLAFLILALEASGLRPRRGLAAGLAVLALTGAGAPQERALEARLHARPGDPRDLVRLGIARAERGRHAEARRAFAAAALRASDPRLAATAYHDLGVSALAAGDLEAARDAFLDALALDPARRRSTWNLEWTLSALREQPPREERPQPEPAPQAEASSEAGQAAAPELEPLSAEELRRWLDAARDDTRRGLRSSGGSGERPRSRPRGPQW